MRKGLAKRKADRKKSYRMFVIISTFIILLFLYLILQGKLYQTCNNDEHVGECCMIENYNPENNTLGEREMITISVKPGGLDEHKL